MFRLKNFEIIHYNVIIEIDIIVFSDVEKRHTNRKGWVAVGGVSLWPRPSIFRTHTLKLVHLCRKNILLNLLAIIHVRMDGPLPTTTLFNFVKGETTQYMYIEKFHSLLPGCVIWNLLRAAFSFYCFHHKFSIVDIFLKFKQHWKLRMKNYSIVKTV